MGFPVGFRKITIPRALLFLSSSMAYTTHLISCSLSALGLRKPPQDETFLWQETPFTAGDLIKCKLPVIKFRNLTEIEDDFVCAVCFSSFQKDDEIRELCNCSHIFHRKCLDKWIDQLDETCPFCRSPLLPPDGDGLL